ncbi:cell filamentation protein Fic [Corynebacterium sp.]|uniref:cell filamentation protein Fic n=1 Tax=Corynebacterium sp. TaxID=1720 RepID=UPI0026DCAAA5|nr:cell filamentation protein Fic [Corynebacterium sp.]MDO5032182.1 cell filamentation protein Fic [Corynebacterium sp.]
MTAEQLLLIAREFCARYQVRVTNFSALAAAAAASTASFEGIPVHDSPRQAARALAQVLRGVKALSARNEEFAVFCARVYLSVTEVM